MREILTEDVRLELTRRRSGYSRISNPLPYQLGLALQSQRREWDSNPRAASGKSFSRAPRYDHFAISPI